MTAASAAAPVERAALLLAARRSARQARPRPVDPPAAELPVARVAVDLPLAHLDRSFDYEVPASMSTAAQPGTRVRVRVAGQELDGFVLERSAGSDFAGSLQRLRRVVSPEPVLDPEVLQLARRVADRYAGTLADVLRLAVPPRVAKVEAEPVLVPSLLPPPPPEPGEWASCPGGAHFLAALTTEAPRAVWAALPGSDWPAAVARAVQAALAGGRGALVVVPDGRDVDRVDAALTARLGPGLHVALTADLGPRERYSRWLAVRRGAVRAVVGTRAAMFAPVRDLGLVVVWDDGDDSHAEPRAPYPHAREVLCLRAHQAGAGALVAGYARTAEGELLLRTGWAHPLVDERPAVRAAAPRVLPAGDDDELARDAAAASARLPSLAWQVAHDALRRGPVLVQVPRWGYLPSLSCRGCRVPARCGTCSGPLAVSAGAATAACGWCARPAGGWRCPHCDREGLRAQVVGSGRTAEELGRAFPSVPVRTSGRDAVLATVGPEAALVVSTPGAEPAATGGYAAALLLDGWALLGRPDLRAGEETLRRWLNATALVRPAADGGTVVVLADGALPAVQALLRWDPGTFAARELDERAALGFPPAARVAAVSGSRAAVTDLLASVRLPDTAQLLGPVPTGDDTVRAVVRVPRAQGAALAAALREGAGVRSARKATDPVRVQIDPVHLG